MKAFSHRYAFLATLVIALVGCGGGGGSGFSGITLTGVAATGAAISSGTVEAKCKTGTGTATSNTDGSFEIKVSNGVGPCMLKAVDPTTNTTLYSFVEQGATAVNINPVTHLVVANVLSDDPSTAFTQFSDAVSNKITATNISTGVTNIRAATQAIGTDADMTGVDFMKGSMKAATSSQAGDDTDKKIDALMASLIASNKKIADLTTEIKAVKSKDEAASKINAVVGNAKTALEGCPYVRSGKIWVLDIHGADPLGLEMDFTAGSMKMTIPSANFSADVALKKDATGNTIPCAFTSTIDGNTLEIRVSEGGVGAWAIPSTNRFGITVPQQTNSSLKDVNFAGTYPAMAFLNIQSGFQFAFPMKFVLDAAGKMTAYSCDTSKSNTTPACNTEFPNQNLDIGTCSIQAGIYSCAFKTGGSAKAVLYTTGSQTTLFMTVNGIAVDTNSANGLVAMTKLTPSILPSVGQELAAGADWVVDSLYTGAPSNPFTLSTYPSGKRKVLSVDKSTNSFKYSYASVDGSIPTFNLTRYQNPETGIAYTTSDYENYISMGSPTGWSLAAGKPNGSGATNSSFYDFSIYIRAKR